MKWRGTIWRGAMVLSGAVLTTLAVAKENPYQSIIDRNAFGLKPPPPPPTNVVEATPPMTVKLTGLINLGGEPKAFFEMTESGPGKLPKRPPGMSKGQELDGVKVLDIDVDKGEVKIRNGTAEKTLNFEQDGIKSAGAVATAPGRVVPAVPPLTLPSVRPPTPGITTPPSPQPGTAQFSPDGQRIITPGTPQPATAASANRTVTVTGGTGTAAPGGVTVTGGAGNPYANMSDEMRRRYGLSGSPPTGTANPSVTGGAGTPANPGLTTIPTRNLRVDPKGSGQK